MKSNSNESSGDLSTLHILSGIALSILISCVFASFVASREIAKHDALRKKACSSHQMVIANAQLAGYDAPEFNLVGIRKFCPPEELE